MTLIGTAFYIIGCVISYILIISITQNTYGDENPPFQEKILVYCTIAVYTLGSWVSAMFIAAFATDPMFRKYGLFPLHYKFKFNNK